jgi:DNA-binding transcriptional MocR family regulator
MSTALVALRTQRDHLISALASHLPGVGVRSPAGGLSLWVTLPERTSTHLVAAAREHGLLLTPGPRFFTSSPSAGEGYLRLPFTQAPDVLDEAVRRLAQAAANQPADDSPVGPRLDLIA